MAEPFISVIIDAVCHYYNVDPSSVLGRSRMQSSVSARQTAMYVARLAGDFSYPQLGQAFRRDHTTAINACRRMASRCVKDERYAKAVHELVREVQGLGLTGSPVKIRREILELIQQQVKRGLYGRSVEDVVDRILCEHFQKDKR